ncbi:hypothetical protein VTK73DRAFT_4305 [Phialemonium thermophilum]|uniref:Uncharacterized protein n=1 Tax=Phialemonium thermophilum TaxID=223376 RepID=A0ABR3V9R3_9PEZI
MISSPTKQTEKKRTKKFYLFLAARWTDWKGGRRIRIRTKRRIRRECSLHTLCRVQWCSSAAAAASASSPSFSPTLPSPTTPESPEALLWTLAG